MQRSRIGVLGLLATAAWMGCAFSSNGLLTGPAGAGGGDAGSSSTSSSQASSGSVEACTPGMTLACYGGPSGTEGVGPCMGGTATCASDGSGFGTCADEVTPQPNNCASAMNLSCEATTPTCSGAVNGGGRAWGEVVGDEGLGIAIDLQSNAVVTGYFGGTLDFGDGSPRTAAGASDAFVAQYSPTGALNWVVQLADTGRAMGRAVTVDANSNVFVVGSFTDQVTFPTKPQPETLAGGPGIFVAKLDAGGHAQWGNVYLGDSMKLHVPYAVALSPDGTTLAVAGATASQLMVGSTMIMTGGDIDGFVFTLDSAGGALGWVQQINDGAQGYQALSGVAVDGDKSVVVTGQGQGNVNFGDGAIAAPGNGNSNSLLLARYQADGAKTVWKQIDGNTNNNSIQSGNAVALGGNGDVFLAGTIQQQINFGSMSVNATGNAQALFAARLDSSGALTWGKPFTPTMGGSSAGGLGIAVDTYGVVVGGFFNGTLAVGSTTLTAKGNSEAVAMKLAVADGSVLWAESFGDANDNGELASITGVALDPRYVNPLGASAVVGYFFKQVNVGPGMGLISGKAMGMSDYNAFFARLAP